MLSGVGLTRGINLIYDYVTQFRMKPALLAKQQQVFLCTLIILLELDD